MLKRETVDVLRCPRCRSDGLRVETGNGADDQIIDGSLACEACGATYEVRGGIANLLPDDLLEDDGWELWKRHLDGFQARRELPSRTRANLLQRATVQSSPLLEAFGRFTRIERGRVLDIGCGPGTLRRHLGDAVEYHGLDPIALSPAHHFDFVRAVVEFLPFRANTFDDVVAVSAVDHFRDVDVAFDEVHRVLRPGGRLHLVQSVHDVRGPLTLVKFLTHAAKDLVETRATRERASGAPKHISEFTRAGLRDTLSRHFRILGEATYSKRWYSPENMFVTVVPEPVRQAGAV